MALGPIGGGIASVAGDPPLIQTETVHCLRNGDRIRIDLPDQGPRQECYAKIADGTTFTPYLDAALKNPVSRAAIPAGSMIAALAQNDYAVVSGINFYPGFRSLQGPVRDATLFRDWLRTSAYVPDSQIDFV